MLPIIPDVELHGVELGNFTIELMQIAHGKMVTFPWIWIDWFFELRPFYSIAFIWSDKETYTTSIDCAHSARASLKWRFQLKKIHGVCVWVCANLINELSRTQWVIAHSTVNNLHRWNAKMLKIRLQVNCMHRLIN